MRSIRAICLAMAAPLACAVTWWAWAEERLARPTSLSGVLVTGSAWVVPTVLAWLSVLICAEIWDARRDGALARSLGSPRWLHGLIAALLSACLSAPAVADDLSPRPTTQLPVTGLPLPDRVIGAMPTTPSEPRARGDKPDPSQSGPAETHRQREGPPRARPGARTHVVRPGESLWRIAEDLLPKTASAARIATATHLIYRLNHTAVGPDPDLIHPGLTLHLEPLSEEP